MPQPAASRLVTRAMHTLLVAGVTCAASPLVAQHVHPTGTPAASAPAGGARHAHGHDMSTARATAPVQPGNAAFAALAEAVRLLEADPSTDWSKVDIEALRSHLIDMDEVVLRSTATMARVAGGATFTIRGAGRTVGAIRRMTREHAHMLAEESPFRATVREVPGGVQMTVTTATAGDAAGEARIRALGFAGILTVGEHHARHHVMVARGGHMHGGAH
jgi:hypothetical protein